jgi:hypothetical protein
LRRSRPNFDNLGNGLLLGQGWVSIAHRWEQLTEDQKLDQIETYTEFGTLRPYEKKAVIERELDVTRLSEDVKVPPWFRQGKAAEQPLPAPADLAHGPFVY